MFIKVILCTAIICNPVTIVKAKRYTHRMKKKATKSENL